MSNREALEGLQIQGLSAQRRYTLTIPTSWGTPTGTPTVVAYDEKDNSVVTSTVLSGAASISGQVITTPLVLTVRKDATYHITVAFNITGGVEDVYFRVRGEL